MGEKKSFNKEKFDCLMEMRNKYNFTWKELYTVSFVAVLFYLFRDILGFWWMAWVMLIFLIFCVTKPKWIDEEIEHELRKR